MVTAPSWTGDLSSTHKHIAIGAALPSLQSNSLAPGGLTGNFKRFYIADKLRRRERNGKSALIPDSVWFQDFSAV
jgi:hypothetical protein